MTCVNKNARGLVERIGGDGWSLGTHEAVVKVISKQVRFIIRINGKYVQIGVRGEGFDAYLKALRDDFSRVVIRKPKASRTRSREVYALATGYEL